jgi:hypothetical protein
MALASSRREVYEQFWTYCIKLRKQRQSQAVKCGTTLLIRKWAKFKENFPFIVNI